MWKSMLKIAAATAAFGLCHSALASRTAKRAAARTFGERSRNGLYRVFYIGQSFVTFGLIAAYIRRQPSRQLYRTQGPLAFLTHSVQAGAVAAIPGESKNRLKKVGLANGFREQLV
jgi:hypothetical protein